ncbi:GlsB/YeaQ/YmgE family stress response membrane protein [Aliiroseovarius marinus]|uniref:GlsB/YeaQ/YmgE family stress response membrane protein n=1 Tax=Aliiroseovarius marinus TaxID=2500159 RepID=UPI003D7D1D87
MPIVLLIIVGAAAGFVATRLMDLHTDVPTTIAIGVAGALIGGLLLRFLLMLTGLAFGFVGALLGAVAVIWIWQRYSGRS